MPSPVFFAVFCGVLFTARASAEPIFAQADELTCGSTDPDNCSEKGGSLLQKKQTIQQHQYDGLLEEAEQDSAEKHGDSPALVNVRKVSIGVIMERHIHLLDPVQQSKAQLALLSGNTSKPGTCDSEKSKCTYKLSGAKEVEDITAQTVDGMAEVNVPSSPGIRWYQNTKNGHLYAHCESDVFENYDEEVLFLIHEEPLGKQGVKGTDVQIETGTIHGVSHEVVKAEDGFADTVDKMQLMDESGDDETDVAVEIITSPSSEVTIKVNAANKNGESVNKDEKLEFQKQSAQTALPDVPEDIKVIVTTPFEILVMLAKKQIPAIMLKTDQQALVQQRKAFMSILQSGPWRSYKTYERAWRSLKPALQNAFRGFMHLINELMGWFRGISACTRCGAGAAIVAVKATLCAMNPFKCAIQHGVSALGSYGYTLVMDAWTFSLAVYWCIICGDGYSGCPRGSVEWHGFCSR